MPDGYSTQSNYMSWVAKDATRRNAEVEKALRQAFSAHIELRQVEVIVFGNVSALELARAIREHPLVLKPLIAVCNIAGRAIERDLQIKNLDTYSPKLNETMAAAIAGYIKPFLPPSLEIPVLSGVDRVSFIDKEVRKTKGRWELAVLGALNRFAKVTFKKRKFQSEGEWFELDAATPEKGPIKVGIDVKRIEARRDIHKRCDEIVNKAAKLKKAYPRARFGAVIYYPFIDEHTNIKNRLHSEQIDAIFFASESHDSVESAVRMMLKSLRIAK
jgi:hypothetical protein